MHFSFFPCYLDHRDLHSFPTRRSSDLRGSGPSRRMRARSPDGSMPATVIGQRLRALLSGGAGWRVMALGGMMTNRSEEHTSELQSRRELVCRLLLEKKKK